MDSFHRLEEIFAGFPGIGPRQAKRFVGHLIGRSPSYIKEFINAIDKVRSEARECMGCHRTFMDTKRSHGNLCNICSDKSRDISTTMIVARDIDVESVEKSSVYNGLYFVLGGMVSVMEKEPAKRVRLAKLVKKIDSSSDTKEVILSLSTTPDGENTATIVREALGPVASKRNIKITVLGRGLSTGTEIEYADKETIKNAFKNRGL